MWVRARECVHVNACTWMRARACVRARACMCVSARACVRARGKEYARRDTTHHARDSLRERVFERDTDVCERECDTARWWGIGRLCVWG